MPEVQDLIERPLYARAEPDDDYYWQPPKDDPHQIHPDQWYDIYGIDEDEEEEQDDRYEHDA